MPAVTKLVNRFPQIIADLGSKRQVNEALEDGAELIAERARNRAPVDTGALKNSIHVEQVEGGYTVVADVRDENGYNYAIAVEFGQFGGSRKGSYGVGPYAFMYPALEESKEAIKAAVAKGLDGL